MSAVMRGPVKKKGWWYDLEEFSTSAGGTKAEGEDWVYHFWLKFERKEDGKKVEVRLGPDEARKLLAEINATWPQLLSCAEFREKEKEE